MTLQSLASRGLYTAALTLYRSQKRHYERWVGLHRERGSSCLTPHRNPSAVAWVVHITMLLLGARYSRRNLDVACLKRPAELHAATIKVRTMSDRCNKTKTHKRTVYTVDGGLVLMNCVDEAKLQVSVNKCKCN